MFDIRWIRENPEAFDAGMARRGLEPQAERLIALDEARRTHVQKLQDAQARRNAASKEIGAAMGSGDTAKADALKAEVGELKSFIQSGEDEERKLTEALTEALSTLPNLPLDEVPDGAGEEDNVELRKVGKPSSMTSSRSSISSWARRWADGLRGRSENVGCALHRTQRIAGPA
jgi:seryl-tRNA synthetase